MRRFFVKSSVGWIVLLVAALLPLSNTAYANHVDSVTLTPPLAITEVDVCSPLVVTTQGTEPVDAVVDIEVTGDGPVRFCLPDVGLNPVLIDPATGDLGLGPRWRDR